VLVALIIVVEDVHERVIYLFEGDHREFQALFHALVLEIVVYLIECGHGVSSALKD